jgi:hypothetical protein
MDETNKELQALEHAKKVADKEKRKKVNANARKKAAAKKEITAKTHTVPVKRGRKRKDPYKRSDVDGVEHEATEAADSNNSGRKMVLTVKDIQSASNNNTNDDNSNNKSVNPADNLAVVDIENELEDELSEFRVGIFAEERKLNGKDYSITSHKVFKIIQEYGQSAKAFTTICKKHGHEVQHVMRVVQRYSEVSRFFEWSQRHKMGVLSVSAVDPFLQEFSEMPNVAFKGQDEVETDSSGNPLAELSPTYEKFISSRQKAIAMHAEYVQTGGYGGKSDVNVLINNNNASNSYINYGVDQMCEMDPRDIDL